MSDSITYISLGSGVMLRKEKSFVELWKNGGFLFRRDFDCRDKTPDFRIFVVEAILDHQAQKTKVAAAFSISRQSIDNWISSYNSGGVIALINSTKNIGNNNRTVGNKARQHEATRRVVKMRANSSQLSFEDSILPEVNNLRQEEVPYEGTVKEHSNRYAGTFVFIILLSSYFQWFKWIVSYFGATYKIFQIFVLMVAKNISSIEQLKNVRLKEAGAIIGIDKLPGLPNIWSMFYSAAKKQLSKSLLNNFFVWQVETSSVSRRFWFVDGHVLLYSGKSKMHEVFNTKRRQTEPGCVNFVTTDIEGKVVYFDIKEGGTGLRTQLLEQYNKWSPYLQGDEYPVYVFDREGDGCAFFYQLVKGDCPFVTWEKNANQKKLKNLPETDFTEQIVINHTKYLFFEDEKEYVYTDAEKNQQEAFTLRRFYIINTSTKKRTSALAYNGNTNLTQEDCIYAILNRWGASENVFKHMGSRQPTNYRPGFKLMESQNQTIANPAIKALDKEIKLLEKRLQKICKELAEKEKSVTKSGQVRQNDAYTKLETELQEIKQNISAAKEKKKELPVRIDISDDKDVKNFKKHDNEGKNLFDFVGALIWNARKKGVEILSTLYPHKNDVVDLFYAIINSQGSVKINEKEIRVILEPLEQSSRRRAQIDFCRRLTELGAKTPGKKAMIIQVAQRKK